MTHPPSLYARSSDFEKCKRQPLLFEAYYRNYVHWFKEEIIPDFVDAIPSVTLPERLVLAWAGHGDRLCNLLLLEYTAGEPIESVSGWCLPVVFITGHGDIEMTVRAMKAGAVDFLAKPFRDQDFLDAVTEAVAMDRSKRQALQCGDDLRARFASLSDREREVMLLAVSGLMNKQIAGEIGISEVTIKVHRARAMRKMAARTFADLVKMALQLELPQHRATPSAAPRHGVGAVPQPMAAY
ncbi:LuxR C-terminal-related transcriptional regulator [Cupriavidus necator]|uniref:LuxR C-terminal-related transcriptional regulator n=1 Tax=Cupriavidus necator TaxID=106590 RepID=UPI00339D3473